MAVATLVAWGGFLIGLVFGAVGQRTGFCLTSGLKGALVTGDGGRLRGFSLALAIAVLGTRAIESLGLVALGGSLYLQPGFAPLLFTAGGLLFGYGMVLANGCGARSLVLLGSGNLRSFVVLVCLGVAALAVLTGLLAPLRLQAVALTPSAPSIGQPTTLGEWLSGFGLPGALAAWLAALALALLLIAAARPHRLGRADLIGGIVVGLLVPAGWLVTGSLGADVFEPVPIESLTFVAPVGEAIQYTMLATGMTLGFGVAVVGGVLAGALAAALASRSFRLEGFTSPQRMLRSMAGGATMGIGGALCLGCSIGQGLSGVSTLSLGSLLAATAILAGAGLGLRGPLRAPTL